MYTVRREGKHARVYFRVSALCVSIVRKTLRRDRSGEAPSARRRRTRHMYSGTSGLPPRSIAGAIMLRFRVVLITIVIDVRF